MRKIWRIFVLMLLPMFLIACTSSSRELTEEIQRLESENQQLTEEVETLKKPTGVLKETVEAQFTVLQKLNATKKHPYVLMVTNLDDDDHNTPQLLTVERDIFDEVSEGKKYVFSVGIIFSVSLTQDRTNRFELMGLEIIEEIVKVVYPDSIEGGTVITADFLDIEEDEGVATAYFAGAIGPEWLTDQNEGTARYNQEKLSLSIQVTVAVKSCTGAIDGHELNFEVDLSNQSLLIKDIKPFTGCGNEVEEHPFEVSDQELIVLAQDFYTTFKTY